MIKAYLVLCNYAQGILNVAQYYAMVVLCGQGMFRVMQLCTRHIYCSALLCKAIKCHAIFYKAY